MYYRSVCKVGEHLKGRDIQSCSENSDSVNEGTSYANCRDETNCLPCLILMASIQQLVWISQQRQEAYSASNPTDPFRARVRFSPWEEEIIFYASLFLVVLLFFISSVPFLHSWEVCCCHSGGHEEAHICWVGISESRAHFFKKRVHGLGVLRILD